MCSLQAVSLQDVPIPLTLSGLLTAVVFLTVAVLLLVTGVALLVVVLAVTGNKLNKLRAEKAHTDPLHNYNQTGGGEENTNEEDYEEMDVDTTPTGGERGKYQELEMETMDMENRQYESLNTNIQTEQ